MHIITFLHQFKSLRNLAKLLFKRLDIRQNFHSGVIYLNAVEHSWAWTGQRNYTTFDAELQRFIHAQSLHFNCFVDIGCNIGVMTLGTLLKNPDIKAVAVDPNATAIRLLKKSLKANHLEARCEVINAVVSDNNATISFDETGSVTGHVAATGREVNAIALSGLLNKLPGGKTLVKLDVEGYETIILQDLGKVKNLQDFTFLIEVHPENFNDAGDPEKVFSLLNQHRFKLYDLHGQPVLKLPVYEISQIVALQS